MRHVRTYRVALTCLLLGLAAFVPPGVNAATSPGDGGGGGYSGTKAAAWADNHWNVCGSGNDNWPCFTNNWFASSNDCANFVSIALYKGGRTFYGYDGSITNDGNWYTYYTGGAPWFSHNHPANWKWTETWARVGDMRKHLVWDGSVLGTVKRGDSLNSESGGRVGDVLFYDWDGDGVYSHVAMVVAWGAPLTQEKDCPTCGEPGTAGDLITQHETNRLHEWWTGAAFNVNYRITKIQAVQISD